MDELESEGPGGTAVEAPAPARPAEPSRWVVAVSCGIWLALLAIHIVILTYVVPSFETMFRDLSDDRHGGLPGVTKALLAFSGAVRSIPGIIGSALAALGSLGILLLPWRRSWKALAFNILAAVAFLLIFVVVPALFLPLVGTIESIGDPGPATPR